MQAAALALSISPPTRSVAAASSTNRKSPRGAWTRKTQGIVAAAQENLTVDYSSSSSVFPAEACETVGGDACAADIFPETKLPQSTVSASSKASSDQVDREYLDYNEPRTVFPGEACDDLGGEFCQPEYQQGVFEESASAAA